MGDGQPLNRIGKVVMTLQVGEYADTPARHKCAERLHNADVEGVGSIL